MTEVSLRKAAALQAEINQKISSIPLTTTIELNEFENPEALIQKANEDLLVNLSRVQLLVGALTNIRLSVGYLNVSRGIHERLTKLSGINRVIGIKQSLLGFDSRQLDMKVISGRLTKIAASSDAQSSPSRFAYPPRDTVETGLLTEEDVKVLEKDIQTAKQAARKISDEILELNIATKITLHEEDVATLTREGIL